MKVQPKYRRPINSHQQRILNTLYKFRFITTSLLAECQEANQSVILSRLNILTDQGYIARIYDNSFKIKGLPAIYYLLPKGVRYLRGQDYTNESALRSIYHDKRSSDSLINHRLQVFRIFIYLKHAYAGRYEFYSKSEQVGLKFLPEQKSDGFLVDRKTDNTYFLEYIEDSLNFWNLKKLIKRYIDYAELGIWEDYRREPFPGLIVICQSPRTARKVSRMINETLDVSYALIDVTVSSDISKIVLSKD